jgi:hypothetical protein
MSAHSPEDDPEIRIIATRLPGQEICRSEAAALELEEEWSLAIAADAAYQQAYEAVKSGQRKFPLEMKLKTSVLECDITHDRLRYRKRKWVPGSLGLRTRLISKAHDSMLTSHPGRENTYKILSREFFWPGMSEDIRQYIRNCDTCGRVKPWRDFKQGLLKPLPVPDCI